MSKAPRSIHEIRAAAGKGIAERAEKEFFRPCQELHEMRAKLKLPSNRRAVVEWYYGKPLEKLEGDERELGEAVALEHDLQKVVYFSEARLTPRFDRLPAAPLLLEFNERYARELERELECYRLGLLPVFDAAGVGHEVDTAAPVQVLLGELQRARDAIANGGGGPDAMASTFRGICESAG